MTAAWCQTQIQPRLYSRVYSVCKVFSCLLLWACSDCSSRWEEMRRGREGSSRACPASLTPGGSGPEGPAQTQLLSWDQEENSQAVSELQHHPLEPPYQEVLAPEQQIHSVSGAAGAWETLPRELPGNLVFHQQSRVGTPPAISPYPKPVATAPCAPSSAFCNYL